MLTPYNILRHELTGLPAKAAIRANKDNTIQGVIIEETRETLKIKTQTSIKTIPKKDTILELTLPQKTTIRVDGNLLTARPEERIKKKYRIKFI